MTHSPLPWSAHTRPSDGQIFGRSEAFYIIPSNLTDDELDPRCVAEFALARCLTDEKAYDPVATAQANATLIAHRVNTYDALVEALETVQLICTNHGGAAENMTAFDVMVQIHSIVSPPITLAKETPK